LRILVSASQQDDDGITFKTIIHPISGTFVNAKFHHPLPDRREIAKVSVRCLMDNEDVSM
jgi:hypothetical protein